MPAPAKRIEKKHAALCFARAFPTDKNQFDHTLDNLARLGQEVDRSARGVKRDLADTGIANTDLHYAFSFNVARWLARRVPGQVSIDWSAFEDTSRLDELLALLLLPAEDEYFDSGNVSSREWIDIARSGSDGTDFDWLLRQIGDPRLQRFWEPLYDAAEIPLCWRLADSPYSKSCNVIEAERIALRGAGMRRRPPHVKQEIQRPFRICRLLPIQEGTRLIDLAMASLAARHRETYHFNHANPAEVYLIDIGRGAQVAVFGLSPDFRFPLECTAGFLILSNGVPIGYGGSSIQFRQVNTGINIFSEYRDSEAAYLWVQVMRVYHALSGCTRFIVNPYQFGADNSEGLRSGAFWFYYRLGFRLVDRHIRNLAVREAKKLRRVKGYRSSVPTLRELASCDLHLALPGARATDLFDERWLDTTSMLVTEALGRCGGASRRDSARRLADDVSRRIGLRSTQGWSRNERQAFRSIAPLISLADVENWSAAERRSLRTLLRAKGGKQELYFARLLGRHERLLQSLRRACMHAEKRR